MTITPAMVKELRERTGSGIMECKDALKEVGGDIEKAQVYLRKQNKVKAEKKADRATKEGTIATYTHSNGKLAAVVAVSCETDFVARNEAFQALAHDLAMHVAASAPEVIRPEEVAEKDIANEQEIARAQLLAGGKPKDLIDRILKGKIEKFKAERSLMKQPFVKDPQRTIEDLIEEHIAKLGENIRVERIVRVTV